MTYVGKVGELVLPRTSCWVYFFNWSTESSPEGQSELPQPS